MSRIVESLYRASGLELTEKRNPENDEVDLNESFSYDFFEKPCSMLHDKLNEDAYDFIDTDPLVQSILKKYPYAFKIPKDERLIIKKEVEKRANEIIDKYRKRITKAFVEQASDYIFGSLNFRELNVNESLNESAYDMRDGGLRDEFYSLIDGMDPAEVVDMMYWYLDDYALEDMIKDIKGHTNETEE